MAIDMIENNDLGALTHSRLGDLNQFTDDNVNYKNFTGGGAEFYNNGQGEDWVNLFGSKVFKKNLAAATKEGKDFVNSLAGMKTTVTCDDITRSLEQIAVYIDAQVKEIAGLKSHVVEYPKARLAEARKGEGILKMKQSKMDCINIQQKAQSEAAKAETLATLTTLSEKSIQNAKADLLGVPQGASATSSNKNLLLYAGLGVGAIVLILLLRRK